VRTELHYKITLFSRILENEMHSLMMSLASTHPTIISLNFRFNATISMAESERNGQYITLGRLTDAFQCQAIKEDGKISSDLVS
jgi:hypothetical protein